MKEKPNCILKILSVIFGTLLGGFIWRCRGESGFGSFWGLCSVGLVLMLLIFVVYGKRTGMQYEKIPIGAFMMGLGVTGYATVIQQMAGFVESDLPYRGERVNAPIDPNSGTIIILLMGFTLVPLFSFFVGSLFSGKEYKIRHYVIAIAIFFIVSTICKATVSHFILKLINPEQVNYALLGLQDSGYTYASPMQAYMAHFLQRKWSQEIPFFENYYMSIEHVSDFIAVIATSAYALIAKKDRITFFVSLGIDLFVATATTAATALMIVSYDTGYLADVKEPRWLSAGAGWGIWEFTTGASVGFIVMLVLALLPKKRTAYTEPDCSPLFENKIFNFVFNMIATVFIFGVVPWRAIGIRTAKLMMYEGLLEDHSPTGEIIMIAGAVLTGIAYILILRKNLLVRQCAPFNCEPSNFAVVALPVYIGMCAILYFFLNHGYVQNLPYDEMNGIASFFSVMTTGEHFEQLLMFFTLLGMIGLYFPIGRFSRKN